MVAVNNKVLLDLGISAAKVSKSFVGATIPSALSSKTKYFIFDADVSSLH
jgi:hypothetical protein